MDTDKRNFLLGGGILTGGAALMSGSASAARAQVAPYILARSTAVQVIPSDQWTTLRWDPLELNTSTAVLDEAGEIITFDSTITSGIYLVVCNVTWDNRHNKDGKAIQPKTHRKFARIIQQDSRAPQMDQPAYTGSCSDLTYHSDLNEIPDSGGFQQQQVYIQWGFAETFVPQRFWMEVYQSSGQDLIVREDKSRSPQKGSRPSVISMEGPLWAISQISEF